MFMLFVEQDTQGMYPVALDDHAHCFNALVSLHSQVLGIEAWILSIMAVPSVQKAYKSLKPTD